MFRLEARDDGRHLHVRVETSAFDVATAAQFRQTVDAAWTEEIERVSLDMGLVELIDSSGIGALVSVHKRLHPRGGYLELVQSKPAVLSVVELLRLHRVFKLTPGDAPE